MTDLNARSLDLVMMNANDAGHALEARLDHQLGSREGPLKISFADRLTLSVRQVAPIAMAVLYTERFRSPWLKRSRSRAGPTNLVYGEPLVPA